MAMAIRNGASVGIGSELHGDYYEKGKTCLGNGVLSVNN